MWKGRAQGAGNIPGPIQGVRLQVRAVLSLQFRRETASIRQRLSQVPFMQIRGLI